MKPKVIEISLLFIFFIFSLDLFGQDLRIVSISPSTTEIIFALGLGDFLVGVDSFSNYPPETEKIEKVGTFSQPNLEKIISLKPDIVFATGLEQNPTVARLKRAGLKVYTVDPANIKELFQNILEIGKITQREREARKLIFKMSKDLSKIERKIANIEFSQRPKVFLEIWYSPLITCGKNSYIDEMISLAGGINIAQNIKRKFSRISQELVIKESPEIIIISYMQNQERAREFVLSRYGWDSITAVKKNRVYADINPDLILRPGPRIIEGIKELYKRFYGENFD